MSISGGGHSAKRLLTFLGRALAGLALVLISVSNAWEAPASDGSARYEQRFGREWIATDFTKHRVPPEQILAGGPPRDGIPAIDKPIFSTLEDGKAAGWARDLDALEPVISLSINGDARAYPLRILIWHEIVNDDVGGEAVAVTYCPLCNASLVFRRELKGRKLDFGTTGLLRHSDLVMYDRQTESWWQQFTGEAIVGSLAGEQLDILPSRLESFASFQTRHPNGRVLNPNDPNARAYGRNPYVGYDSLSTPFLFSGDIDVSPHRPMDRVVAFTAKGRAIAVPFSLLRKNKEITIHDVRVTWSPGQRSALDTREIARGRDVGSVTVMRAGGGSAQEVPYHVTFAFVFRAFHPGGPILQTAPPPPDAK